jgi:hypothetical protein
LKKSKFQQILGSGWCLHGIFSSFQIFLADQQSKLSSKHVSGGERARRAGIFLNKSKFPQILGSGWRLHGIFSSFQIFLADQQSKLMEKLENSALNKFLVVSEPENQKFSLKNQNFSRSDACRARENQTPRLLNF